MAPSFAQNSMTMAFASQFLWRASLLFVCAFCLVCLLRAQYNARKHGWESHYFILLCVVGIWWALSSLFSQVFSAEGAGYVFTVLRATGPYFVPGLVCLHIWRQVSYKDITPGVIIAALAVPVLLTVVRMVSLFDPAFVPTPIWGMKQGWNVLLMYAYAAVALVKACLLCLNVFYQMPRHMRKSTYYLLAGIIALMLGMVADMFIPEIATVEFALLGFTAALFFFSDAFRAASSANVIVTSRDFVFGNLSTMILVLSNKGRILDWNKKEGDEGLHMLPVPAYKEPFSSYKERIVKEGNGQVSSHGDNIITTVQNGEERHYLITIRDVRQTRRQLGHIAEISEVTKLYSIIRYLEDIATVDQLTGLHNRNSYMGMVRSMVEQKSLPLLVLVGDVNNLKQLNDIYGHLNGDALLIRVAKIIQQCAPEGAFTARIGGDEYVVLVPEGTEETAKAFTQAMQEKCRDINNEFHGVPSVSWGYAIMQSADEDYNEVFSRADQMMYADKKQNSRFRSSGFVSISPAQPPATERPAVPSMPILPKMPAPATAPLSPALTATGQLPKVPEHLMHPVSPEKDMPPEADTTTEKE